MVRRFNSNLNASGTIAAPSGVFANLEVSNSLTVSGIPVTAGTGGGGGSPITVQEIDGSPSVSNVTTIRVSNSSLTNDGGGQVTISTGGSTGAIVPVNISGTSMSYFEPMAPPATGTTVDDEFDQNPFGKLTTGVNAIAIDSKWTEFDPDGIIGATTATHGVLMDGFHLVNSTPSADNTICGYYQTIPTRTAWQFVTKVGLSFVGTSGTTYDDIVRVGLFLADDNIVSTPTTADLLTVSLKVFDTDTYGIAYEQWTDYNSPTTTNIAQHTKSVTLGANEQAIAIPDGVYLKFGGRSGGDRRIDAQYSFDGVSYTDVTSSIVSHTLTTGATKIGIFKAAGTGESPTARFQFFRLNDQSNFFRDATTYGRRLPLSGTVGIPDTLTAISGSFSQSLTISGVPVSTGTDTLQQAYTAGDGTITTTALKPLTLAGTGRLVAVTGTFSSGLTVGGSSTHILPDSITTASGIFTADAVHMVIIGSNESSNKRVLDVRGRMRATRGIAVGLSSIVLEDDMITASGVVATSGSFTRTVEIGVPGSIVVISGSQGGVVATVSGSFRHLAVSDRVVVSGTTVGGSHTLVGISVVETEHFVGVSGVFYDRATAASGVFTSGLNIPRYAIDPVSTANGDLWINTTTSGLRWKTNGFKFEMQGTIV